MKLEFKRILFKLLFPEVTTEPPWQEMQLDSPGALVKDGFGPPAFITALQSTKTKADPKNKFLKYIFLMSVLNAKIVEIGQYML